MERVLTTVVIQRPIAEIFDYVSTPGNWPKWHPSSLAVSGATDHSLEVGEKVSEDYLVAGRRGRVVWTVAERDAPRRWTIVGDIEGGGGSGGTISYTLTPTADGVRFEREFVYTLPEALLAAIDGAAVRRQVEQESEQAVRQLKSVLEANDAPSG